MKKELMFVALGFAINEIADLALRKMLDKRKKKIEEKGYEDQWKAYAMKNPASIFDNDLEAGMNAALSLLNTKETENKSFKYTPSTERRRFPFYELENAAWSWAF